MAEKKFFVDINLQGSALTNAKIGTNSGIGSTEGAFGYDSGSHRLQYFNGSATQNVANLSDISAVTGGLIFQGGYDPTTNTPDIADGSALKGYFWAATAAGTFLGESVQVGDSIVAKVDNAGATIADWLILQGNIVIATDSVDGISRLATQTEANDGTEGGAVVITPATLQGKIDAQITPEISSKLPLAGGTMSGDINLGGNNLSAVNKLSLNTIKPSGNNTDVSLEANLNAGETYFISNLPAPTNGGDAANKTYVDDQDALKVSKAGDTMSGDLNMGSQNITEANAVRTDEVSNRVGDVGLIWDNGDANFFNVGQVKGLTSAPTANTDATNKLYVDTTVATAESNANDYTDAELNASRYTEQINPTYWTLVDNAYTYTLQHLLSSAYPVVQLFDNNNRACELGVEVIDAQSILLTSNIIPSFIYVTVLKGGAY